MTIELAGVTVRRGGRTILGPLDWTARPGERWAVPSAPNGSGKTTLLQVVSLYLWLDQRVTVDVLGGRFGRMDAREQRRRIGYAGSALEAEMDEDLSPSQLVLSARHAATEPWWHVYTDEDRARARGAARALIGTRARRRPSVRDPVRRRAAAESIARALMPDPDLLLLDERPPASTSAPARPSSRDLTVLAAEPRPSAIVLVSHHVEEIPPGFTHALVLPTGRPSRPVRSTRVATPTSWSGLRAADRGRATRRPGVGTTVGLSGARWSRNCLGEVTAPGVVASLGQIPLHGTLGQFRGPRASADGRWPARPTGRDKSVPYWECGRSNGHAIRPSAPGWEFGQEGICRGFLDEWSRDERWQKVAQCRSERRLTRDRHREAAG